MEEEKGKVLKEGKRKMDEWKKQKGKVMKKGDRKEKNE